MKRKNQDVQFLMSKLNITEEQALELIAFDSNMPKEPVEGEVVVKKVPKTKKGGIQVEELEAMKELLKAGYSDGTPFKNKDISTVMQNELGLSNRATPSRLRALKEQGFLEEAGNSSPKVYKIKNQ